MQPSVSKRVAGAFGDQIERAALVLVDLYVALSCVACPRGGGGEKGSCCEGSVSSGLDTSLAREPVSVGFLRKEGLNWSA